MIAKVKANESLRSKHFITQIIGVVLVFFTAQGVETGYTPDQWYDLFVDSPTLSAFLLSYVVTPVYTLIQRLTQNKVVWDFFKTENFITYVSAIAITLIGLVVGEEIAGIVIGAIISILNVLGYLTAPTKEEQLLGEIK